jgi:histidine ammonia-lyase
MSIYKVGEQMLSISVIAEIIAEDKQLALSTKAKQKIKDCRDYLDKKMEHSDAPIYGINTGFGSLCNHKISNDDLGKLQTNLVLSHACGTGDKVPDEIVKIMLLLKVQSLSYGHSGVQLETVERLIEMFNKNILPVIFQQGSLGASGDLAPLAHLSLPLLGEGRVVVDGEEVAFHEIKKDSIVEPTITYGNTTESLTKFLQVLTPTIWFADGGQLFQNSYVVPKERVSGISLDNIIPHDWTGVAINKEAQGIYPYKTESIQYHFINEIRDDFQIIYDDDGSGEIADVIGINDGDKKIDIHLFHLKYAKNGHTGNDIGNFYEVCGQAQKSLNWKYRNGKDFFDHLLRRKIKKQFSPSAK